MTEYRFSALIGHDEDGYWGQCPELQGCYTQGITFEETVENLKEAIALHLEDRRQNAASQGSCFDHA